MKPTFPLMQKLKIIFLTCLLGGLALLSSCRSSRNILKEETKNDLLKDSLINSGHLGISIYEPSTGNYIYNYNAEKYFTPASTTKLFTLYAGLKYLGDSISGFEYKIESDTLFVLPTGDPTYLHRDFALQPAHDFLNASKLPVVIIDPQSDLTPYGKGWAWDDAQESYMPQRSVLPSCGNILRLEWVKKTNPQKDSFAYDLAVTNTDVPDFSLTKKTDLSLTENKIERIPGTNHFTVTVNNKLKSFTQEIPFETFGMKSGAMIYQHSLYHAPTIQQKNKINRKEFTPKYSQQSDSVFKMMMWRSDNFFAEQTLLMVSNKMLGIFNDEQIIDTLLKSELKDIPQMPRWVDGSGLSRYNLFSPKDFVYIINKMQQDFGVEKLKTILPTGGKGTLKNYFISDSSFIYAKTGSLSNNFSLSGFMTTKKNKQFIFSVMLNNYQGSSKNVRKVIEKYLQGIREKN